MFERPIDTGKESIKDLFQLLTSEAKRRSVLIERQQSDRAKLRKAQRDAEKEAISQVKNREKLRLEEIQDSYVDKSRLMDQRQQKNRNSTKEKQQRISARRNALLVTFREQEKERKKLQTLEQKLIRDFDAAAQQHVTDQSKDDSGRTDSGDLAAPKAKRIRRPRDPSKSRRKRDIAKREMATQEPDNRPELDR